MNTDFVPNVRFYRWAQIPLALLAVFFWASLLDAESDQSQPAYGDAIVVASIADARTLVPILASDSASGEICGLVFNGLVKYDKNINIVGDLAESWDIEAGGLVIVFHLRKDVKWHDGMPFTAYDVEFTYKKLVDPAVRTPYSGDFERIKKLEVADDHTVRVVYKEPFSPGLSSWGMSIMPRHLLKDEDLNKTSFSRHPVGTGPYKFRSWKSQEKIELVSNHEYFEGRPYIDRYIYRIIPDEATIFLELQTRGADMSGLTPLQFTRQTDNKFFRKYYQKFRYPGFGYTYMGYNLSDERFRDIRVRQAINFAVNKEEIIGTILFGLAKVTTGPFITDSWAYNKEVKPASYDPAKARLLLKEAGWADEDGDGWLEKDGKKFEFTVLVNQGNSERLKCAEMIQGYLKAIGIRMKIRVLEWSTLINEFIDKRHFEAVLMGWSLSRDPDCYDIWHSSKTREGEFNFIGYKNPEVDHLLEEGRRTFDRAERERIYHEVHRLIYEDQPCLFLYSAEALPVVSSRFHGIEVSPNGIGYNFIKWYVPREEQRYR
ncbi:MAG: peptide-binding protein [Candidatus Omnitrophica bacterium]|nr:peptide-binding protein [Candidatus Omnitrophota bacterium]